MLQKIIDLYIKSSIHVAFSVYALIRVTELYFDLPFNYHLHGLAFFGTITAYNYLKYGSLKNNFSKFKPSLKIIFFISVLSLLLTTYCLFQLNLPTVYWLIPFIIVTVLYTHPFDFISLRTIAYVKISLIGLVWAVVTVILPFVELNFGFTFDVIMTLIQRLLFVVVLTIPFDIRDYDNDESHLKTLPITFGIPFVKKIAFVLMGVIMLLEFFIVPNANYKFVFVVIFILLLMLIQRSTLNQSKYYSSFWVEGIPILWYVLLLLF